MDGRGERAFTPVFDGLCPGHDALGHTASLSGTGTLKPLSVTETRQ